MNKVLLIGRLTRDVDVRYTQGSEPMCVAKFTIAVDRRIKKENEQSADFISCTAFGKNGQFAEKYLIKGTKIAVEGRWQTGSYKNQEGQTIYTNDCIVDSMEFAESKQTESAPQTDDKGFMSVPDGLVEELPFK